MKKAFDLNGYVGIVYFAATALAIYHRVNLRFTDLRITIRLVHADSNPDHNP